MSKSGKQTELHVRKHINSYDSGFWNCGICSGVPQGLFRIFNLRCSKDVDRDVPCINGKIVV